MTCNDFLNFHTMKLFITTLLLTIITITYAQDEESSVLGKWIFQSMSPITKVEREEITIVYKNENNVESLTFDESDNLTYNVTSAGIEKTGRGFWCSDGLHLTIITREEGSDEFY